MDDVSIRCLGRKLDVLLDAADVALADLVMPDRHFEALVVRGGGAAAHADDHVTDLLAAHLLRGRHGRGNGAGGGLHIDDVAGTHAERGLVSDTDDTEALAIDAGHETHDLVRSDVERRNDAISRLRHDVPRLTRTLAICFGFYAGPGVASPGLRFLR